MSANTHEYLVVLTVLVDDDRPWWEALGMPDPAAWSLPETFGTKAWAKPLIEEEVVRG
jgi:hypothetical protein